MNSQDVTEIEKAILHHIKSYLVTSFLSSLMGEGEKTEIAIHDVLSKKGTHIKMQELIPNIDAAFIRKMIAVLSINADFCETIKNMQLPKEEAENMIISKLKEGFSKQEKAKNQPQ